MVIMRPHVTTVSEEKLSTRNSIELCVSVKNIEPHGVTVGVDGTHEVVRNLAVETGKVSKTKPHT